MATISAVWQGTLSTIQHLQLHLTFFSKVHHSHAAGADHFPGKSIFVLGSPGCTYMWSGMIWGYLGNTWKRIEAQAKCRSCTGRPIHPNSCCLAHPRPRRIVNISWRLGDVPLCLCKNLCRFSSLVWLGNFHQTSSNHAQYCVWFIARFCVSTISQYLPMFFGIYLDLSGKSLPVKKCLPLNVSNSERPGWHVLLQAQAFHSIWVWYAILCWS